MLKKDNILKLQIKQQSWAGEISDAIFKQTANTLYPANDKFSTSRNKEIFPNVQKSAKSALV